MLVTGRRTQERAWNLIWRLEDHVQLCNCAEKADLFARHLKLSAAVSLGLLEQVWGPSARFPSSASPNFPLLQHFYPYPESTPVP
jgi:hypothetical protein